MTNEEAIAYLEGQRACICSEDCNNPYDFYLCEQGFLCNDVEAINMAISALEKQVPKKPIKSFDPHDNNLYRLDCPTCERIVGFGKNRVGTMNKFTMSPDRCGYCGQAIDWSNET